MTNIYHQLGHRYGWSIDSVINNSTGDGVICAPRYMKPKHVEKMPSSLRNSSFFDPQFFLPSSTKGALPDWNFFPNVIADGFSTVDYGTREAERSSDLCASYQKDQDFKYYIIPTRLREGLPSDFIDSQKSMFIDPFLKSFEKIGHDKPILLQLILNDTMLKDDGFRNSLLSWVTGIREIDGVYLIPKFSRIRKQIDDIDYSLSLLKFIHSLRINQLDIIVGYLNIEAFLLLAADPTGVTMGSYENLRIFSPNAFDEDAPNIPNGPNPRIYLSKLLQLVDHKYIGAISRVVDNPKFFFDDSDYNIDMFSKTYNWHFSKPESYRQYFQVFSRQLKAAISIPMPNRFIYIYECCKSALKEFEELESRGIVLDQSSDGSHLPSWLTALNLFGKEAGFI